MIIQAFNIRLRRMQAEDIEEFRQWRDSGFVRLNHIHRGSIGKEEQERWFTTGLLSK